MSKYYPDISHWSPVTDWTTVKANCPFLISKATQGTSSVDPTLDSFISGCEANKIPYWLFAYLNKGSERAQAEFLVQTCKDKIEEYFIGYILDVEDNNTAENVQEALAYLNDMGYKTMIYHKYADYSKYKAVIADRGDNCAWWEARYGKNDGSYNSSYPPHNGVDFHQYTDVGTCDGISGNCDMNRLTGTLEESWFTTALNEDPWFITALKEESMREKPIDYLTQYLGIKEGSAEHKAILAVFNDSGLCTRYTMTTKDSWCATGVSAAFIASGLTDIFPCVECSCGNMVELAQKAGIWVEDDSYTPSIGDVLMYDWDDDGKGDNTGWPDHVGIVVSVSDSTIKVIECNINDTVGYRSMTVDGKYIRGFIAPKYTEDSTGSASTQLNKTEKWKGVTTSDLNVRVWAGTDSALCSTFGPLLKGEEISVCDEVTAADGSTWYYIKTAAGKYGFASAKYIVAVASGYTGTFPTLPPRGYYQKGDGITTLTSYTTQIKRVQKVTNWVTGGSITVDGQYGSNTVTAVKAAQKILGVTQDGEFGSKTLATAKAYKK